MIISCESLTGGKVLVRFPLTGDYLFNPEFVTFQRSIENCCCILFGAKFGVDDEQAEAGVKAFIIEDFGKPCSKLTLPLLLIFPLLIRGSILVGLGGDDFIEIPQS